MSFSEKIMPLLNGGDSIEDCEWYLRRMMTALNLWFKELEKTFSLPVQEISGTGVLPSYPPQTISVQSCPSMKLVPRRVRFTFEEVKTAMWGDSESCKTEAEIKIAAKKSFIELFNLIGKKIGENWKTAAGNGITFNGTTLTPIMLNYSEFYTYGEKFFNAIQNPLMTPELFHTMLDAYLSLAINNIPPVTVPVAGRYNQVYVFTGTVKIQLPEVM